MGNTCTGLPRKPGKKHLVVTEGREGGEKMCRATCLGVIALLPKESKDDENGVAGAVGPGPSHTSPALVVGVAVGTQSSACIPQNSVRLVINLCYMYI